MAELMAILLFVSICLALMAGYPVAFTLGGVSLLFAGIGVLTGTFDAGYLSALPNRLFGIMNNQTMLAVPLFVFMGVMLERSRVAEDLLESMSRLFGTLRGGLAISVCVVGALLAASTGIFWASVGWRKPEPASATSGPSSCSASNRRLAVRTVPRRWRRAWLPSTSPWSRRRVGSRTVPGSTMGCGSSVAIHFSSTGVSGQVR